jgi:hypothetical protein
MSVGVLKIKTNYVCKGERNEKGAFISFTSLTKRQNE